MRSLDEARYLCEKYHPGLIKALAEIPLLERERPGSPIIDLFRSHGGPSLLVPAEYSGYGVGPLEAVRIMRALSSYSPSLGAAVTMHHFTVAMLFSLAKSAGRLTPAQLKLLSDIAPGNLLVASGWAEGRPDQNILIPTVTASAADGGYIINGGKKPCSLSASMNLLTASVALAGSSLAVLLIPSDSPGISVHPFWSSWALAAAQSHEVRLSDVFVPGDLVIRTVPDDPNRIDDLQDAGFVWFEMLISSVYVGATSLLVARALARGKGSVTDRAEACVQLEASAALIEGVARAVEDGVSGEAAVAAVLTARFAAQRALAAAADLAAELLGGIAYMQSSEIAYLTAVVRPLAYHPPSRSSTAEALVGYYGGQPLRLS
ncbi:MAG TPA: acyl-CoA dehydrogenase family protein [Streptosporangiaceae bacterium]